jgi:hypothetical protein
MKKKTQYLFSAVPFILISCIVIAQNKTIHTQVLVVGGTTGGIAAGIQSARSGANTVIVEQTNWLGGMLTAAGVSCTDGNDDFKSGIWQEFRNALLVHYKRKNLSTGWVSNTCFEPHVGDSIFKSWAIKEKKLSVIYNWYFNKAIIKENKIIGVSFIKHSQEQLTVYADIIIDATDLGDVFANANCRYDIGTEDSIQSNENIAPGKSNIIQDLTWAATLQDFGKDVDKTITQPKNYNPKNYYCSTVDAPCNTVPYQFNTEKVLDYGKLPVTNSSPKYMLNWPAHGNDFYLNVIENKPIEREALYVDAKNQTLGFIYFLQTQLGMKHIGLANEFGSADQLALMPYNREGRRVKGIVRLNINHIKNPYQYNLYRTGIAVGDYPVDHHHAQYPGKVPPIPFPKIPSYTIPLGALIPEKLNGIIVCEKGVSVSNITNGTTRLQPVVLLTGQAAGIVAALCVKTKKKPRNIDIITVQKQLVNNNCYILPFFDITPNDKNWKAVQTIGAIGFIKGTGVSEGWSNKTYFYPDSIMYQKELAENINAVFNKEIIETNIDSEQKLTEEKLLRMTNAINSYLGITKKIVAKNIGRNIITRKEIATFLVKNCNLNAITINWQGDIIISNKK